MKIDHTKGFSAKIYQTGKVLDFSFTTEMVPVISEHIRNTLEGMISPRSAQFLPITNYRKSRLYILNVLDVLTCVDETASIFEFRTDVYTDQVVPGEYEKFDKLILNMDRIPAIGIFRIKGWETPLFITESIKKIFDTLGIKELNYYPTVVR